MSEQGQLPPGVITFGPDSNCDLDSCPVEWSIYQYRPSLGANVALLALFAIVGIIHTYLGIRWRKWGFMTGMILGSISTVIGYIGRIMLRANPFSFQAFMIQIICLTIAPVFYTASIYVTLSNAINFFAPDLSRFKPQLFIWIFIPADVLCLVLQAAGGALSTESNDGTDVGVDITMAGLILQVVIIFFFIVAFADYMFRYWRSGRMVALGWRVSAFFAGLTLAILLILARCSYRVAELKEGYSGEIITHQIPFIVLEGFCILLAAVALMFGHPGLGFKGQGARKTVSSEESGFSTPEAK